MLREIIDLASLEDFAGGLARAARLRACIYDEHGALVVASPATNDFALLTRHVLTQIPARTTFTRVPAHDPPGVVAFIVSEAIWYVAAPVFVDEAEAGFVALGEFREHEPLATDWPLRSEPGGLDRATLKKAWDKLPLLDRSGQAHAIVSARWAARLLAEWLRGSSRAAAAAEEVALVGDIAQLLTGQRDLQTVLERIVADTARVMKCPRASMRLYDPATGDLRIKAVHNLPAEYLQKGAVLRTASAIDDEALRGHVVYVEDVGNDPRVQYPDIAQRYGIVSLLTAGMIYRAEPVGVIRVYTDRRQRFRKAQRDLLRAVAYQAATAIVHANLVQERLHNAETQRQLALAGELQQRMMRVAPPQHPLIQTALAFHPTYTVAGDFCDFTALEDGRLMAVIGDVSGKGIPASLLVSSVRGALRAHAKSSRGPGELLRKLNRQIHADTRSEEFVTLTAVAFDPDARGMRLASAGHEPALLVRDGEVRTIDEADLVLGIQADVDYQEYPVPLQPDDLLLLYTDGIVEARNFNGEAFGRERLHESLLTWVSETRAPRTPTPDEVLRNLVWDVRRFVGLAEQSDDMTLVAVRLGGGPRQVAHRPRQDML